VTPLRPPSRARSLALLALLSVALLAWPGWKYAAALTARRSAEESLVAAHRTRDTVSRLRAAAPEWLSRPRPTGDAASHVHATLRDAGLPPSTLLEATPSQTPRDERAGGPARAALVVRLAPLTLPEIGAFLDRWRASQPHWRFASLDLTANDRTPTNSAPLYSLSARLTTLYSDD
jgi:hypothetical protein